MTEKEKQYDEEGRVIRENRSALKRERDAIKAFAEELLKLPAQQYSLLPINDALVAALIEGKRLNGNAYQRHLNYLTRLMIEQNPEAIRHAHEHINHPYLNTGHKIQQIQSEIARLLQNDKNIYNELITRYQDLDIQYIRQLVRETQKHLAKESEKPEEQQDKKPGKHQCRLQKYLQSLSLNLTDTE